MIKSHFNNCTSCPSEQRQHFRHQPVGEQNLVAISGLEHDLPYHLVDIGNGGMSFRYFGSEPLALSQCSMDVYTNRELAIARLPVTVMSDYLLQGEGAIAKRRCGLRFGTLTQVQRTQLAFFIRSCTSSEVKG